MDSLRYDVMSALRRDPPIVHLVNEADGVADLYESPVEHYGDLGDLNEELSDPEPWEEDEFADMYHAIRELVNLADVYGDEMSDLAAAEPVETVDDAYDAIEDSFGDVEKYLNQTELLYEHLQTVWTTGLDYQVSEMEDVDTEELPRKMSLLHRGLTGVMRGLKPPTAWWANKWAGHHLKLVEQARNNYEDASTSWGHQG